MNIKSINRTLLFLLLSGFFLASCSSSSGNKAPIAYDQSITLNENTIKEIVLSGSDPENDAISYKIISGPNHGVYQGNKYIPSRNFHGQDSFSFLVNDGKLDSALATISITVNNVDEPSSNVRPVAASLDVIMVGNTHKEIIMAGTDENGDTLSFEVVSAPTHGTYVSSVYTPDTNYLGTDSFSYIANDGQLDSSTATVNITITESGTQVANVAPVATAQQITMLEDTSQEIVLSGTDSDGDTLSYQIVTAPTHGTYTGSIYTPNANYFGEDSFTFKANDGQVDSATAVVTITITDVAEPTTNVAPIAIAQQITMLEDTSQEIVLSGTDSNGDTLSYQIVTAPTHGTYTGSIYTPNANYFGEDSFTFKANDGQVDSATAVVTITITDVVEPITNVAPVATAQQITMLEDTNQEIILSGTDGDGDTLTYEVVSAPEHGVYTGSVYTPEANYFGTDSFTFKANDGQVDSALAIVNITITNVGEAPVATAQTLEVQENGSIEIVLSGIDEDTDNNALTFQVVDAPSHGVFDGSTYTPEANYIGNDSFTFTANDGVITSEAATVNITVIKNTKPVANGQDTVRLQKNLNKRVLLTGSDIENDDLSFIVVNQPSHGQLTGAGADLMYHPESDFYGDDSFTFKVNDGAEDSEVVTINLKVVNLELLRVSIDSNSDGEIDRIERHTISSRNQMIVKRTYRHDLNSSIAEYPTEVRTYSTSNPQLLLSRIHYNSTGDRTATYVYTYNANKQLIEKKYAPDNNVIFTSIHRYTYDANGNRNSDIYDNNEIITDGFLERSTRTFDSSGRELVWTRYDNNNAIISIQTNTYGDSTKHSEYDEGGDGTVDKIYDRTYNIYGDVETIQKDYNGDGAVDAVLNITYDVYGNYLIGNYDNFIDDEEDFIVYQSFNLDGNIISSHINYADSQGTPTTMSYGSSNVSGAMDVDVLLSRTYASSIKYYTYGFVVLP